MFIKKCVVCLNEKPMTTEYWYRRKESKDGYRNTCKQCIKENKKLIKAKIGYKFCNSCGRELPSTKEYFHKTPATKDGLNGKCKECMGYKFDRDKLKPKEGYKFCAACKQQFPLNLKYFIPDKRNKQGLGPYCRKCFNKKSSKSSKKRYWSNPEKTRAKAKKYRENHKESIKKYNKRYSNTERGRERKILNTIRYRTRKRYLENKFSLDDWSKCKRAFSNKNNIVECAYCGKETLNPHKDHFIPLTKGGETTINNIIPCCGNCNSSKNNKNFFSWYPKQTFFSEKRQRKILKYLNYKDINIQQLKIT